MKPMLATRYDLSQVKFPCLVQPKYDGVRCIVEEGEDGKVHLRSRTGKEYNVPQIMKWAESNRSLLPLDGEIYVHKRLTFQEICSAVKCQSPLTKKLKMVVYDRPIKGVPYVKRMGEVVKWMSLTDITPVYVSLTLECNTEEQINNAHRLFVENGYEGAIIRNMASEYVEGRSNNLMKLKTFETDEYEIVDIKEAGGLDAGTGIFRLKVSNTGYEFYSRPTGSKSLRARYLQDKHVIIGKMATVQHQGFTDAGIPRFPVTLTVRDYE